jgi:hypothetical protein
MHPTEVLFFIMHIQLERVIAISVEEKEKNLLYWWIFNFQNVVWKCCYCNRYVTYFSCEDRYVKFCALFAVIK